MSPGMMPTVVMVGGGVPARSGAATSVRAAQSPQAGQLGASLAAAADPYNLTVIAKTGGTNFTGLGNNPSINDGGNVAFVGKLSVGNDIFVGNGSGNPTNVSNSALSTRDYGEAVWINNGGEVAARLRVQGSGSLPTFYRIRTFPSGNTVSTAGQGSDEFGFGSTFFNHVSINNLGSVAFAAAQGTFITLAERGGGIDRTVATFSAPQALRPAVADGGEVVIRAGESLTSPIRMYALSGVTTIADASMGFTRLGRSAGVSDDARIVTFYGDLNTAGAATLGTNPGPGIFASIQTMGGRVIQRVAGVAGNGFLDPGETFVDANSNGMVDLGEDTGTIASFDPDSRVAVNLAATVAFIAFDSAGHEGIYTSLVNDPANAPVLLVAEAGGQVPGLGTVQDLAIYDPLNNKGEVAFWVTTTAGVQGIVRASALTPLDLDVDSDNTNGLDTPDRSEAEDQIEDDPTKPGKFVSANVLDQDNDKVPDFADGFNRDGVVGNQDDVSAGVKFTPLVLEVPQSIDLTQATFRFTYDGSNPAGVTVTGTAPDLVYTPAPGHLRIWRKNGDEARDPAGANATTPGDYVAPAETYTAAQLGLTDAMRTLTLFVEGVASSVAAGDQRILVELDPDGAGPAVPEEDAVRTTIAALDLDVDSDNNNGLDIPLRSEFEDQIEDDATKPGKYVSANISDVDHDEIPDFADGFNQDGIAGNQDDVNAGVKFAPMVLEIPQSVDLAQATFKFNYDASDPVAVSVTGTSPDAVYAPAPGHLRIWTKDGDVPRSPAKANVSMPGNYVAPAETYTAAQLGLTNAARTVTLYVEGIAPSATAGDQLASVQMDPDGNGPVGSVEDAVRP